MRITLLSTLLFLAFVAPAQPNREKRTVSAFDMVTFRLPGTLYLRQGSSRSVEIEAPPGVLGKIETRVSAGRLFIEPRVNDPKHYHEDFDYIKVYVTTIQLESLHLTGSGKVFCEGKLDLEKIDLAVSGAGVATMVMKADSVLTNITGSGHLILEGEVFYCHNNINGSGKTDLKVSVDNTLHADISGSGELNLNGKASKMELILAGSGRLNGFEFEVSEANINIAGSGHADIKVSKTLKTEIHGSGAVNYKGNPQVTSKGSSKAIVTKVGD